MWFYLVPYKHSTISVLWHDQTKRTVCWQGKCIFFLFLVKLQRLKKTNKFFLIKGCNIEGPQNTLQNKFLAAGKIVLKKSGNYSENDSLRSHILSKQLSDNVLFKCWKGFENVMRSRRNGSKGPKLCSFVLKCVCHPMTKVSANMI